MKKLFFIISLLFTITNPLYAQWERIKGPSYGGVSAMAYNAPYLFAATTTGVFRTNDNGLNWDQVKGLPENTIKGLAVAGNKVFAACWFYGLYVSNDNGNSWEKAGSEMPIGSKSGVNPTLPYYKLYSTPNYLYCGIGGVNYKIYRSSDQGSSWQLFLSNQYINDMIQDADTILINNGTNTTRSINNGGSWTTVTGLSPNINNKVILGKINNTWVGALPNTANPFRYSTDGGATFSNGTIPGAYPFSQSNIITIGNKIFISTSSGIYESTNGINWTLSMPATSPYVTDGFGFMHANNGDFWMGSYKFYLSQNQGATFAERNYGLTSLSNLSRYNYNANDHFLYTSEINNASLLRSADNGNTWNSVGTGFASKGSSSRYIVNNGNTYFSCTDSGLYKSTDNAITWNKITAGLPTSTYSPNQIIKGNTELYLATTNSGVYKSADSGLTWTAANAGFVTTIARLKWHQNKLYAACAGGLLLSVDSGLTWTSLNSSLGVLNRNVTDFTITNDSIITCLNYSKIYRSTDYGTTWNLLNQGVNPATNLPGEVHIIDTMYFYSNQNADRGVYMCSYNNPAWTQINYGLSMDSTGYCAQPKEMTHDSIYLYLNGYGYGAYRLALSNILVSGRVSGKVFWDKNGNGTLQANEPLLKDESLIINPGNIAIDTDTSGIYRYNYLGNTSTIGIQLHPKPYWTITSSPTIKSVTPNGLNIDTLNFGIKMIPGITDITAELNATVHRPGSRPNYFLTIKNKGTDTISDVAVVTLDNNLTYLSGNTPQNVTGNVLTFAYNNLKPGEEALYLINTEVNSSTTIGSVLNSNAVAYPLVGDSVTANNYGYCKPIVQASFDPNNKTVEPSGNIASNDELKYQINFQNTGNDTAFTVIVRDTISSELDLNTFVFLGASHPATISIKSGRVVEFRFDQIMLPDSTTDEVNSHGLVRFSIFPRNGILLNTTINNTAHIYFDYNTAVTTNSTTNTITSITSLPTNYTTNQIGSEITPNPISTRSTLTLFSKEKGLFHLSIFDGSGRLISTKDFEGNRTYIDRNDFKSGIYFYEVITPLGNKSAGKISFN